MTDNRQAPTRPSPTEWTSTYISALRQQGKLLLVQINNQEYAVDPDYVVVDGNVIISRKDDVTITRVLGPGESVSFQPVQSQSALKGAVDAFQEDGRSVRVPLRDV